MQYIEEPAECARRLAVHHQFNVCVAFKVYDEMVEQQGYWKIKWGRRLGFDLTSIHAEIVFCVPCSGDAQTCLTHFVQSKKKHKRAGEIHYLSVRILENKNSRQGCMNVSLIRNFSSKNGGKWEYAYSHASPDQLRAACLIVNQQIECQYNRTGMHLSFMPWLSLFYWGSPGCKYFKALGYPADQSPPGFVACGQLCLPPHYFHTVSDWFCSEFVMALLLSLRLLDLSRLGEFKLDPWRMNPSRLYRVIVAAGWYITRQDLSLEDLKKLHREDQV